MRQYFRLFLLLTVLVATTSPARTSQAQGETASSRPLTVGIYVSPPFVMKDGEHYSGMAIELWQTAAKPLNLGYSYREYPTFEALVEAIARGEADVAVSNLTITKDRARRIAFSQPWYDAGLRIMVVESEDAGFWQVINGLKRAGHLWNMTWLVLIVLIATIVLALFYRHFDKHFPRSWHEGLAESFYEVMSVTTSGKVTRANVLGWSGRIFGGIWMICGVAVVAYLTSAVTSVMTALVLTHQINSLADLPGRSVGVLDGSVSESYSNELRLATTAYPDINRAVAALTSGQDSAIVGDAPVLEYYVHTNPTLRLSVVGPIFHPDKYGFGFSHENNLRQDITLQILALQETGELDTLRRKYFGHE